jgi:hypothetical protein
MLSLSRRAPALTIVVVIVACHSLQSLSVPEPGGKLEGDPQVVSVSRQDHSVLPIYQPTVKGDSLVGWLEKPKADSSNSPRVAVSLFDIREISVRNTEATTTTLAFLGGVLIGAVLVAILILSSLSIEGGT